MEPTLFHKQVGSKEYHNETANIQKRLKDVQQELSMFRQRCSAKHVNTLAASIYTVNDTSVWTPGPNKTIDSVQLSYADYSLSGCDFTPPHVYTDVSEIQDNSNSSPRQRSSKSDLLEPLSSSIQFPQNSTPRQAPANVSVQRECLSECVRHLVFGDDTTMFSDDIETTPHSGSDSGYSSAPDPSLNLHASLIDDDFDSSFSDSCVDSDSSGFFESPLTHRAVTHKASKKHAITQGLKQIGKKIKQSRIGEFMSTLAVL